MQKIINFNAGAFIETGLCFSVPPGVSIPPRWVKKCCGLNLLHVKFTHHPIWNFNLTSPYPQYVQDVHCRCSDQLWIAESHWFSHFWGVRSLLLKTFTPFKTKIYYYPYSIYDLTKHLMPYGPPDPYYQYPVSESPKISSRV